MRAAHSPANAPSRGWAFAGRGRVRRPRSYQQRFQQTAESILSQGLITQRGAEVDATLQSHQQALLAFLVARAR
eukprot:6855239-Alexandrium_andersonii.AAC.1